MEKEFKKTEYLCEGCRKWKMLKKRESDGKLLCKRCFKNKSLTMEIKKSKEEDLE